MDPPPQELLNKFEKLWNGFLDEVKAAHRAHLPSDFFIEQARATKENAAEILGVQVSSALLPYAQEIVTDLDRLLLEEDITLARIPVSTIFREDEASREPLKKWITAMYLLASSVPMSVLNSVMGKAKATPKDADDTTEGGSADTAESAEPDASNPLAFLNSLTEELIQDKEVTDLLENVSKDMDLENGNFNPFKMLGELQNEESPMRKVVTQLGGRLEQKIKSDTKLRENIEKGIPAMMDSVTKMMGGMMGNGGFNAESLAKMMGQMMGTGTETSGAAGNPLAAMANLFGGGKKEDHEELPEMDDIIREVRSKQQKEFREASRREAMRRKLDQRRKQQQPPAPQ